MSTTEQSMTPWKIDVAETRSDSGVTATFTWSLPFPDDSSIPEEAQRVVVALLKLHTRMLAGSEEDEPVILKYSAPYSEVELTQVDAHSPHPFHAAFVVETFTRALSAEREAVNTYAPGTTISVSVSTSALCSVLIHELMIRTEAESEALTLQLRQALLTDEDDDASALLLAALDASA